MLPKQTQQKSKPESIGFARKAKRFILLVVVLVGLFFGLKYYVTHRGSSIPEIKSGIAGACIDDYKKIAQPNARVVSWQCNGTAAQNWKLVGDQIIHNKYCLAIAGNGTSAGDRIVLDPCNGEAGEIWNSAIGGYENPASATCLSDPNDKIGIQLTIASCTSLTKPAEVWTAAVNGNGSNNSPTAVNCNSGTEGQRIACYAAEQWTTWNSGRISHNSLLNTYSDGNGYEEWCADFISYVYKQAGYPLTNGERDGWDEYVAGDMQYDGFTYHSAAGYIPQTGDVAYFDYPGGHIEIVAIGGANPVFIYGDSGTTDPTTGNGDMTENSITNDGSNGQVIYYLTPN